VPASACAASLMIVERAQMATSRSRRSQEGAAISSDVHSEISVLFCSVLL
jgi:hypothetical protein